MLQIMFGMVLSGYDEIYLPDKVLTDIPAGYRRLSDNLSVSWKPKKTKQLVECFPELRVYEQKVASVECHAMLVLLRHTREEIITVCKACN